MDSLITHHIVQDRILRYDITGPITTALLMEIGQISAATNTAMRQKHTTWASIAVLHGSSRLSDDGQILASEEIQELRNANILPTICSVVIAPGVDGFGETEAFYAQLHAASGNHFRTFDNYADAFDWTQQQLQLADDKHKHPAQPGRTLIWRPDPQIIQYELIGPIDLELFLETTDMEKTVLQELQNEKRPWSSIVILSNSCRFVEGGENFAPIFMAQRQDKGLNQISACYVAPTWLDGAEEMREKMYQLYKQTNLAIRIFETYSEALDWTRRQLNAVK